MSALDDNIFFCCIRALRFRVLQLLTSVITDDRLMVNVGRRHGFVVPVCRLALSYVHFRSL